jgi:hypothetical protein
MGRVKFSFNKERDLFNIWETASAKSYGYDFSSRMPKELVEFCRKNSYAKSKKFIYNFFSSIYKSGFIDIHVNSLNKSWKKIEKEYFKKLETITGRKLKRKRINAYVTIAPRCPYDPKEGSFMVNFFANLPMNLQTAGHEIMHIHFHENYFEKIKNEIGYEKAHDLKEAMTVLLNIEFKNLWYIPDNGYESHKKFREFIANEWKKEKNFDKLLIKCVEYIKKDVK